MFEYLFNVGVMPHNFICIAFQLDVVGHIDTLIILLSPRQVHLLLDLFGAFSGAGEHLSVDR